MALLSSMELLDELEEATSRVDACEALQLATRAVGNDWTDGLARMSDQHVSNDVARADKRRRLDGEDREATRARATHVYGKPVESRAKSYHRAEAAEDEIDDEAEENYAELVEYLRIAVINVYLENGAEPQDHAIHPGTAPLH